MHTSQVRKQTMLFDGNVTEKKPILANEKLVAKRFHIVYKIDLLDRTHTSIVLQVGFDTNKFVYKVKKNCVKWQRVKSYLSTTNRTNRR